LGAFIDSPRLLSLLLREMKHKEYRLAAVMFTDIVGFSRMMEEDEAGTLRTLDFHNRMIESLVKEHNGVVIKTIGDAFLSPL
jgi:class 3 adenylate cyclase